MSEMTVFWWFLLKLVWPNCLGFLECFSGFEHWKSLRLKFVSPKYAGKLVTLKSSLFFSFFSFPPFLSTSFLSLFPSFLFPCFHRYLLVLFMSISVLSGSRNNWWVGQIFHLLFELTVDGGRQNFWQDAVWWVSGKLVETILGKNNGTPGYLHFGLVGTQETAENKTDKFSLLRIAFRYLPLCVGGCLGKTISKWSSEFF